VEAVHVELAHEGGVVVVFEEFGDQGLRELVLVEDDEGVASVGPADQVGVFAVVEKTNIIISSAPYP
jgi:hypothetical protein